MSHEYSATLIFRSFDLGKDATLVLTFDDTSEVAIPGIFKDVFPTVAKIATFKATGPYEFRVTYTNHHAFTRAQIDNNIVSATTYTHMATGKDTILTKGNSPTEYLFSTPRAIVPPTVDMIVVNGTDEPQNIGAGVFEKGSDAPSQIFVYPKVDAGAAVLVTAFSGILRGYIVSGYQENQILKSPIASPVLFAEKIGYLLPTTYWRLIYHQKDDAFEIQRE